MAKKMHPVNCLFEKGEESNLFEEDFLEAQQTRAVQVNTRAELKNEINQKVSVFGTIT